MFLEVILGVVLGVVFRMVLWFVSKVVLGVILGLVIVLGVVLGVVHNRGVLGVVLIICMKWLPGEFANFCESGVFKKIVGDPLIL